MSYCHLPTNTERHPGRLEAKLSDGYQISAPEGGWTPELAALCGFVPVTSTPQPNDTDMHTHERAVVLVDGTPTVTWTPRAKTADELAAVAHVANAGSLEAKARAALAVNATFLAAATPSTVALRLSALEQQVSRLTRQNTALIRLLLRGDLLDDTTGT